MTTMEMMPLGHSGIMISRLGLGCWAIGGHGWGRVDDAESVRAIRCALDNGITFYDTADAYGLGKSEFLLSDTLGPYRNKVVIATKGGVRWDQTGKVRTDISPAYLRIALEKSLRRLRLDHIPLYYIHKPDGITPVQEAVAALEAMRKEGKIGAIGLANFSGSQLAEALQVASVAAVQVRLNIFDREAVNSLLPFCKKHRVTLVAWGALADGLLTGKFTSDTKFGADDHRSRMPAFMGENLMKNIRRVTRLDQLAAKGGRRLSHLALRWVLDNSELIAALFGAKTDMQVMENMGIGGWRLTEEELTEIEAISVLN